MKTSLQFTDPQSWTVSVYLLFIYTALVRARNNHAIKRCIYEVIHGKDRT